MFSHFTSSVLTHILVSLSRDGAISLFLCVFQSLDFVLPSSSRQFIICHSCLPCFYLCLFISLSLYLSICLSVGVAREVEQCEEAGSVGQTAGGASAGHRGGRPASKVCLIRCGAAHLPGALPQQRALQVEFIPALISFGTLYFNTTCHQTM